MEQSHNSSRRLLWAGVGVVVIIFVVVVTALTMMSVKKDDSTPAVSTVNKAARIATKDEVKQDLAKADASLKQYIADRANATAAQKDNTNRIKVGS